MTHAELQALVAKAVAEASEKGIENTANRIKDLFDTALQERFGNRVQVTAFKDVAAQLLEQAEYKDLASVVSQKGGRVNAGPWPIKLPRYGLKEGEVLAPVTKATVVSSDFVSERSYLPFFRAPSRRLHMRDVVPVQGLGTPQLEYARIINWTNSAGGVAEGAEKPESGITAETKLLSAPTMATYIPVSRRALRDVAGLAAYINQVLAEFLAFLEDDEILNGDGTGQHLTGILADADIIDGTGLTGATAIDKARKAITLVQGGFGPGGRQAVGFEPTAFVYNPSDWEAIELTKDLDERYILIPSQGTPAGAIAVPALWGVPVVVTPAIDAGSALLGAFDIGATLWTYDDVSIRVSDGVVDAAGKSYFLMNLVAVLAEMRELFAIYLPKAFVKLSV